MNQRRLGRQEADVVEMFDHALAVELVGSDDLEPRLQHMDDGRQIELVGQHPAGLEEVVGATLGCRRRHQHADAAGVRVMSLRQVAHEIEQRPTLRARQCPQVLQHVG